MFVQSAKFVENHGGNINRISVFGQDSNPTTWKMAQMNLAIRGIEADLGKYNADTFFNDCHPQLLSLIHILFFCQIVYGRFILTIPLCRNLCGAIYRDHALKHGLPQ